MTTALPNIERARRLMADARLDAIVVASPTNVRYLGGVHNWLAPSLAEHMVLPGGSDTLALRAFALLPLVGEPGLVLNSGLAVDALSSFVSDVRLYGRRVLGAGVPENLPYTERELLDRIAGASATPLEALGALVRDRGLDRGRIGVELGTLSASAFGGLAEELPDAWIGDCSALVSLIRMVKTESELSLLEGAAAIGERAAMAAFATIRPGAPIRQVSDHFRASLAAAGASFDHFAAGMHGLSLATLGRGALRDGDVVCVDFGAIYEGYFSDSAATISLGSAAPDLVSQYEALVAAVDAGIATAAPGVPVSTVHAAMAEVLAASSVVCDPPTGHGLGLEVRDWPVIVADNGRRIADGCVDVSSDLPLEVGMAINLEISAFLPGRASLEVERTIVITDSGARDLVPQPRERMVAP
jgi:Xaa-Pro aminopeptidase